MQLGKMKYLSVILLDWPSIVKVIQQMPNYKHRSDCSDFYLYDPPKTMSSVFFLFTFLHYLLVYNINPSGIY